jgi:alpha-D-xyloside xylohydrolase
VVDEDIGGFLNGDVRTDYFKELMVRWFQYGVFCPLFRLHGNREPSNGLGNADASGAPNEVWTFGDTKYAIISYLMFLREKLCPYLMEQKRCASQTGLPPMRPVFVDFPADLAAVHVEDQFMLRPDLLVAPVLEEGSRERSVYLPAGADWVDARNGDALQGGQTISATAPIEKVPVYWRKGSQFYFQF